MFCCFYRFLASIIPLFRMPLDFEDRFYSLRLVTWQDLSKLKGLSMTVNVLGAVADVAIAAGLFYFLQRSRTGFKKSDTMISKLIMFSVSTGLLTSVCAVASLLSILIWGKTLIYVAFYFSLGRLYSNSLLATLNARKSIRGLTDEPGGGEASFSLQTFTNKLSRSTRKNMALATNPRQTNISIKVDTTQELVSQLPPGPKGLPIIGNVLDMPTEKEWETFAQWGDEFGDISSVTVLGQPLIILNSAKVAVDLLDKRSSIYSDRPSLQMAGELCGWKNTLVLLPYGDRFKRFRRLFHNTIGSQAIMRQYYPAEEQETKKFLRRVLAEPEQLQMHVRKTVGAVVLRISHGYEVQERKDPFVDLANTATEQFSLASSTGQFLVDCIPALKYVPDWMPGAGFKLKAKEFEATLSELVERPHNFVKQQISSGTAHISFTSSILESRQLTEEEEFDLKWSAASLYSGASDTSVSSIYSFFLAMVLHPGVVRKAQAEIDAVVGNDRLPTFADREHLPYINALVKEVFRWNVVTPLAVPHRAAQDDFYNEFFIPKGSLIIPNLWKLTHDPRVYHSPMEFKPERYLAEALAAEGMGREVEPHPRETCFGFGRRICPGMHLADSSVYIACAMALSVFDIDKCVEDGVVIEPVNDRTSGTISHPKPFKCSIKPRSPKAVTLIMSSDEHL
ncbi:hypothetical protein D9757_000328 [Collybiopsis confluens]|uniref:DUF6534 domain-containing protein n=1 Tax=Collybiopsis confluens TaxID=2823264 RepID=A0A8H5I3J8_9AGAR|nr:hypothetical protein D9757_000328 [Collybiopsis confluens]